MARSSDVNQRIVLTGAEEVRRHLEEIGKAGERSGNQTRTALLAATQGTNSLTSGAKAAGQSSGQLRFALQNLSFQVNDVATSLASGGDVMRVFAQQGGQVFQVFQQGGGFGAVMRGAGAAIASMITPMTAAVAGAVALGAGFALLISRAASAESSAKQFDVILKATGRSGGTTGKELEEAAEQLHDVGVAAGEARELFKKFVGEGGIGSAAPKVIRVGAELNKVFGEGSLERFVSAAAQGGAPLKEFARQLGIVVVDSAEVSKALDAARKSSDNFNKSLREAGESRGTSIADLGRDKARQFDDLSTQRTRQSRVTGDPQLDAARQRAAQEEDIEINSKRRIEDINRQHAATINNLLAQRNQANADALAAYNEKITTAAQAALDKTSLIQQIAEKIFGSFKGSVTPLQQAVLDFSVRWNELLDTLAKSETFTQIIKDLGDLAKSISGVIKWLDELVKALGKVPGLPAALGGSGAPPIPGSAGGEYVRGPGTGTSDSILRRVSNGEFIVNAMATRANLPLLQAINGMRMPAMPQFRVPKGFAAGGPVSSGGGGAPVNIHLDGRSYSLIGDRDVVNALSRGARRAATLSAGRRPSTA